MTLEIGTRVKIKKSSEFYGQSKEPGTIISEKTVKGDLWYNVEFDDGYKNCYQEQDLDIPGIDSWREIVNK